MLHKDLVTTDIEKCGTYIMIAPDLEEKTNSRSV